MDIMEEPSTPSPVVDGAMGGGSDTSMSSEPATGLPYLPGHPGYPTERNWHAGQLDSGRYPTPTPTRDQADALLQHQMAREVSSQQSIQGTPLPNRSSAFSHSCSPSGESPRLDERGEDRASPSRAFDTRCASKAPETTSTPRTTIAVDGDSPESTGIEPLRLTINEAYGVDLRDAVSAVGAPGSFAANAPSSGTGVQAPRLRAAMERSALSLRQTQAIHAAWASRVSREELRVCMSSAGTSPPSLLTTIESTPAPNWDDFDTPSFHFYSAMGMAGTHGLLDVVADEGNPLWFVDGCGPSPGVQDTAELMFRKDTAGAALSRLQGWNLRVLKFVNHRRANSNTFVAEANAMRLDLVKIIESTHGKKDWAGHSNVGDPVSDHPRVGILKHYAPPSCLIYDVNNRIHRKNPCIVPWLNSIARSMHKEAGGVWDEAVHPQIIDQSIFFVDLIPIIPFSKKACDADFNIFAADADSTRADLELSGFLLYCLHARAHLLLHEEPVTVAVASRACWKSSFNLHAPTFAPYANVLGMVAHGQCWAMRVPLMNVKVHSDEKIEQYSSILLQLYWEIALLNEGSGYMPNPHGDSRVAQRFGARNDDLSPEELQARIAEMEEHFKRFQEASPGMAILRAYMNDETLDDDEISCVKAAWKKIDKALDAADTKRMEVMPARWKDDWDTMFDELVAYKKEHGHCNVPQRYEASPQLGQWVQTQRQHYKLAQKGLGSSMNESKVETLGNRVGRLNGIGFQWKAPMGGKRKARSPWSGEEDARLKSLVAAVGPGSSISWASIAEAMGNRSDRQCRDRWNNSLQPGVKIGNWTTEEDRIILSLQKQMGNKWAAIAKQMPGRNYESVKNRWSSLRRSAERKKK